MDHSMDSKGADDEHFRRDSTERNVHVGSSTQATSEINLQLKVMDFPFFLVKGNTGRNRTWTLSNYAAFLGSSTSSSLCWRCAVCLSGGQSLSTGATY